MSVWGTEDLMHIYDDEPERSGDFKIRKNTVITILGGAGLSAESGVPTFRGHGGLWSDESLMQIATPRGFMADPERGWRFYNDRRVNMKESVPNAAHRAIARMEEEGYDIAVITQNIDGLHHEAGSTSVLELHGSVWRVKCTNPACLSKPFENHDIPLKEIPLKCDLCGSYLRPDVVFFEEQLDGGIIDAAGERTKDSDLFLVIGTSGVVYPAAGFAQIAKAFGAYMVELNLEHTPMSPICDETRLGPCGETLPELFREMTDGA